MKLGKIFVLTGAFLVMTNSANAKLPGYTEGAEIMPAENRERPNRLYVRHYLIRKSRG